MAMLLLRVPARRFSSAAVTSTPAAASSSVVTKTSAATGALSRFTRFFEGQPIENIPELKTLQVAQQLAEKVPADAVATKLTAAGSASHYRTWFKDYQAQKNLASVDSEAFTELMKDVSAFIQTTEKALLSEQPKISLALGEEEDAGIDDGQRGTRDVYVEAMTLMLARHKVVLASADFSHLDVNQSGSVDAEDVEQLLATVIEGSADDWLRYQFRRQDKDSDDVVDEVQSKAALDAVIAPQKAAFAELLASHVGDLPKKHTKMIANAMDETEWKEKLPEKVRCVFHFAAKEDEKDKTIHWETFKENQEMELPELHTLMRVYAKGMYNERYAFYEYEQEKRGRRIKGLLLALSLAVGDVLFTLI